MPKAKQYLFYKRRLCDTGLKVRNVIFIVYLEDLEKSGRNYYDLLEYLDSKHCKAVVSPIHDRDHFTGQDVMDWCTNHIDPETGDLSDKYLDYAPYVGKPKKKHVHVGILSKSQRNAKEWADFMAGLLEIRPSMFEKMEDFGGFTRYCAHLDSPDKAKYNAFDIVGIAGADLSCLARPDEGEKVRNLVELTDLATELHITTYHGLSDMVMHSGDLDMISCFRSNSAHFAQYFRSKSWERMYEKKRKKARGESDDVEN